jgi:hypothetical protein
MDEFWRDVAKPEFKYVVKHPEFYCPKRGYICPSCRVKANIIEYEIICPKCSRIIVQNMCTSDLRAPRLSAYKFENHYDSWIMHILAREEMTEELQGVIAQIPNTVRTIEDVRRELKKIKRTKYNKHSPLILKRITGTGPPEISDELLTRCRMLFFEIFRYQQRLYPGNNSPQYPYIIYKIFDAILSEENDRRILRYIHLPTLVKRDKELNKFISQITRKQQPGPYDR